MITDIEMETLLQFGLIFTKENDEWSSNYQSMQANETDSSAIAGKLSGTLEGIENKGELAFSLWNDAAEEVEQIGDAAIVLIQIPIFLEQNCLAIVALGLKPSQHHAAALECWTGHHGTPELAIQESITWGLDRFAEMSQYFHFPIGAGIPGKVWQVGAPIAIDGLGSANPFMRSSGAMSEGLETGWGIPVIKQHKLCGSFVALTGKNTRVSESLEVYLLHEDTPYLVNCVGSEHAMDDEMKNQLDEIKQTGMPVLFNRGDQRVLLIPHAIGRSVKSATALYF